MNSPVSLPLPPSLYADTAVAPTPTPPLDADKNVSVAIIGGGFTGLSTALHLAGEGGDASGGGGRPLRRRSRRTRTFQSRSSAAVLRDCPPRCIWPSRA